MLPGLMREIAGGCTEFFGPRADFRKVLSGQELSLAGDAAASRQSAFDMDGVTAIDRASRTPAATADEASAAISSTDLLPLVYDELRRLAAARLKRDAPGQTLQATALVHEAFLRLREATPQWAGRAEFFSAASEAMRRILIERARRQVTLKRGGPNRRFELNLHEPLVSGQTLDLLALDEALQDLERHDRRAAELVKLRFFAGLGHAEAAEILEIERRVADRLWVLARTWLYRRLGPG